MRLPIGQSNFAQIIESNLYFVDKSLFVKEVIEDEQIILITRPRRFGKTLNLSMLHYFFDTHSGGASEKSLFDHLAISKETDLCLVHQSNYPVISFSFKDVKQESFSDAYAAICNVIKRIYSHHRYLLDSETLAKEDKDIYKAILERRADKIDVQDALLSLTGYLRSYHGKRVVVLIDEYDTPIQSGYLHGYYSEVINFFRGFFGAGLKDNEDIFKAVLTGILRVAKENLFSGLNNLSIYSMLDKEYGAYFGFTEAEVSHLLKQAELEDRLDEIRSWYNGYKAGGMTLYNPWSIANYIKKCKLQAYWINTSDNALVRKLMTTSSLHFKQQFENLLWDKPLEKIIDPNIVFADLDANETAVWSLLLMSGYLKSIASKDTEQGIVCRLQIPNREVRSLYRQIIEQWLSDGKDVEWYNKFLRALLTGDMPTFKASLGDVMLQTISCYDVAHQPEAFYHGLMIGLTASLDKRSYQLKSNKESGHGRYDILMVPTDLQQLGIVIELKSVKPIDDANQLATLLEDEAQQALQQINSRHYDSEFRQHGLSRWLKIGLAFSGKHFYLAEEQCPSSS